MIISSLCLLLTCLQLLTLPATLLPNPGAGFEVADDEVLARSGPEVGTGRCAIARVLMLLAVRCSLFCVLSSVFFQSLMYLRFMRHFASLLFFMSVVCTCVLVPINNLGGSNRSNAVSSAPCAAPMLLSSAQSLTWAPFDWAGLEQPSLHERVQQLDREQPRQRRPAALGAFQQNGSPY